MLFAQVRPEQFTQTDYFVQLNNKDVHNELELLHMKNKDLKHQCYLLNEANSNLVTKLRQSNCENDLLQENLAKLQV